MATYEPNRMFSTHNCISNEERLNATRLPALLPPRPPEQQETATPRRLASVFTRMREAADAQSELMTALVPLTQLMAAAKSSTSPSGADPPAPKMLSPAPAKPKRKRIRLKTERRREQCRHNQARYRDRQRGIVRELEQSVQHLQQEIQGLTTRRHILCYGAQTKHDVWHVAVEYFRLLRYGFLTPFGGMDPNVATAASSSYAEPHDQEFFLRASMADDVEVGELTGVDALIKQWKRYSSYFGSLHLKLKRLEQQPLGDVVATATLSLTITEATLRYVFPHLPALEGPQSLNDHTSPLYARLLRERLECPCTVRFMWDDSTGRVTRLDSAIDFLSPLLRALGSLEDVSCVLGEARITPACLIGEIDI